MPKINNPSGEIRRGLRNVPRIESIKVTTRAVYAIFRPASSASH